MSSEGATDFTGENEARSAEDIQGRDASGTSQRRVTLEQACHFVGVGHETLLRFLEAGYFPGSSKESGISVAALEAVFGVRIPSQFVRDAKLASSPAPSSMPEIQTETLEPEIAPEVLRASPASPAAEPSSSTGSVAENNLHSNVTMSSSHQGHQGIIEPESDSSERLKQVETSEAFTSVPRRNLMDMYERLIGKMEEEIKSLKSERDWLKARIERFEEKTSRDQVLMLAETQTIRTLIAQHEQSKSPVKSALRWLGLLPAPEESSTATKSS